LKNSALATFNDGVPLETVKKSSMWSRLGVLGSRVVEAVFVNEDTERSEGSGGECNPGVVTVSADTMEGSDAKILIAKRMGVPKDEVDNRLIALSQKGELNGTAGRSATRALGNSGRSPTLTKKDLDDFERAEADARSGTASAGTPFKPFKPSVLNGNATPKTPRTPPPRSSAGDPHPHSSAGDSCHSG
jgi:hypothetical protein